MECMHCGSTNTTMTVSLMVKMDSKYLRKITKKSLREKNTKLMAATWETAMLYCNDCKKCERGL